MTDVFKALADASRRHLLDELRREDGQSLNEMCRQLDMSRQAVSKHLAILEEAGLVVPRMDGRVKHHYLNPVPLREITLRWLTPFAEDTADALLSLKDKLEQNI